MSIFGNPAKSLFYCGGANYMPVSDLEAATVWYKRTFGVKSVNVALDDGEGCVALGFDEESCLFVLGPRGKSSGELTARLFTRKLEKSRDYLQSRGVSVGAAQQDEQGTHFFQAKDVEGNPLEISEEP
jgi:catechol 2,3-dioxygenase-like lactoylglutathione lyase family enzyme